MQQQYVLAELGEHIDSRAGGSGDRMTLNYLQALNYLFEHGFLSHDKITFVDSHVLSSMEYGCQFFSDWLDELFDQGKYYMSEKVI